MAQRLRAQLGRLTDEQQQRLSSDISLGFRFYIPGLKSAAETDRRHGRRAERLVARLAERNLASAFLGAAQQLDMSPIELDLKLHEPMAWLKMFYGSGFSLRGAYQFGVNQKWDDSCGSVSSMLLGVVSADAWDKPLDTNANVVGRAAACARALELVRDTRYPYLRMLVGCHSFMVESLGSTCRVYQAYFAEGGDRLSDSIAEGDAMPRQDFCTHLGHVIGGGAHAEQSAAELFRGTCDATANQSTSEVSVEVEVTETPRGFEGMKAAFVDVAGRYAGDWQHVEGSNNALDGYIQW